MKKIIILLLCLPLTFALALCTGQVCADVADLEVESEYEIIIVGGGYAGMTTAYFLKNQDIKVLEKESEVGGRAVRGNYEGLFYSKGTEYLGEPYGALKKVVDGLNIKMLEIPSPMDIQYHNGTFYHGTDGIALMHAQDSSLAEYNRFRKTVVEINELAEEEIDWENSLDEASEVVKRMDRITAKEWFVENKFSELLQQQFDATSRGLWGANLDEVSALMMIPELAFEFVGVEPFTDTNSLSNTSEVGLHGEESYIPLSGAAEIPITIAKHLGDKVQVNSTVKKVSREGTKYHVLYSDASGKDHLIASDMVILAVPAPVVLHIAPDVLTAEHQEILKKIEYSVYCTVSLFSDTPIFDRAFDLAVPVGAIFTDIYDGAWVQKYYDKSAAKIEKYIAVAYVPPKSFKDKSLLSLSDEALLSKVCKDLDKVLPGSSAKVTGHDIYRFKYAYPVMEPGAFAKTERLNKINNGSLLLTGDYLLYPTCEGAADASMRVARKAKQTLRTMKRQARQ